MSGFSTIKYTKSEDGFIHTISLNRPKKMNAMNFELMGEIGQCIKDHVDPYESGARCLIIKAEGKHFTSGLDITSMTTIGDGAMQDDDLDLARKSMRIETSLLKLQDHITRIEKCRVPVIVAVHGYCIGVGIDLTAACDIRLCAHDVKFTIKVVVIGICADLGTIQRFYKSVGNDSWARELAYTGRVFGHDEAKQRGYVSRTFETKEMMFEEAEKLAGLIAQKSPVAVNTTKKSIVYSRDHTVQQGLDHIAILNGAMLQTEDTMKAVSANFSKQIP